MNKEKEKRVEDFIRAVAESIEAGDRRGHPCDGCQDKGTYICVNMRCDVIQKVD